MSTSYAYAIQAQRVKRGAEVETYDYQNYKVFCLYIVGTIDYSLGTNHL